MTPIARRWLFIVPAWALLTGVLMSLMVLTHPQYPGVDVSYIGTGPGVAAFAWENGYGFNRYQEREIMVVQGGFAARLDRRLLQGAVQVEITLESPKPEVTPRRPDLSGPVSLHVDSDGQTATFSVSADETTPVFELPNAKSLRSITVSGAGGVRSTVFAPPDREPGSLRLLLIDRRGEGWIGLSTCYPEGINAAWTRTSSIRQVAFDTPRDAGPGYRVAVVRARNRTRVIDLSPLSAAPAPADPGGPGWFACDPNLRTLAWPTNTLKLVVQGVMAALVAAGLVRLGRITLPRLRQGTLAADISQGVKAHRHFIICFAVLLAWFGLFLVGQWPGLIGPDSYTPIQNSISMRLSLWYSIGWPLWYIALEQVWMPIFGVVLVQTIVCAALLAGVLDWAKRRGVPGWVRIATALLVALSPPVIIYNVYHDRNGIVTLETVASVVAVFGLCVRRYYDKAPTLSLRSLWWVLLLLILPPLIRPDNLVLSIAALALLGIFRVASRVKLGAAAIALVATVMVFFGPVTAKLAVNSHNDMLRYKATAMVHQMAGLVAAGYRTSTPAADNAVMEKVMSLDVVRKKYYPDNIGWYFYNDKGWSRTYEAKDLAAFRNLLVRAAIQNPEIFLGQRARAFTSLLFAHPASAQYEDYASQEFHAGNVRNLALLHTGPVHDALYNVEAPLLKKTKPYWTTVPQLVILFLVIFAYRWIPLTAAAAALMLPRLGVMFLMAPAVAFYYLFDLHLLGLLLPLMACVEIIARRRATNDAAFRAANPSKMLFGAPGGDPVMARLSPAEQ